MPDETPKPDAIPGGGGGPTPPVGPARPMMAGPISPATVTPQSEGLKARGRLMANWGLNLLEQAAQLLGGSKDEDGADVMGAVLKLRKKFGSASADLSRQEVKLAGERASPIQSVTPQMGEQWQNMVKSRLANSLPSTVGAGAPPGAPNTT